MDLRRGMGNGCRDGRIGRSERVIDSGVKRIDLHTHILPDPSKWPDWTARSGYAGWIELAAEPTREDGGGVGGCACARMQRVESDGSRTFFRRVGSNCWDPSVRLREMAEREVGVQVLSTVPVMFSYWAKPRDALSVAEWLNDDLAATCAANPGRFIGLGTIPMQSPDLAIAELERCVRDLRLPGVQIGTNVAGRNFDEEGVVEVLAAAERLGACVFVHPWDMLGADRMPRYWMPWLVGMPAETALAVCSVLMGGVLDRLPKLRLCFAHGGGSFAGTLGRIEHGFEARPDLCQTKTNRTPRSYLAHVHDLGPATPARFFVDSLTHEPDALRTLIRLFTPERIALGSDYPFPLGEDRPGEMILGMRDLSAAVKSRLLAGTAEEFLWGTEGWQDLSK